MTNLNNVPVSELLKILNEISKETPLCNIIMDKNSILLQPVYDSHAIKSTLKIKRPEDTKERLDIEDLDKLI